MIDILFTLVTCSFILGAIDFIIGNKFGLGEKFKEGICATGSLAFNMIGIYLVIPIVSNYIKILPTASTIDASILPTCLFAVDMGGLQLALELASTPEVAILSGILLASMLGATLSFSVPVAIGIIEEGNKETFLIGLIIGIISIPVGVFVGGLVLKIDIITLIRNLLPLFMIVLIFAVLIIKSPNTILGFFRILSKILMIINIIGIIVPK